MIGRKRQRDAQAVDAVLSDLRDLHLRLSSDLSAVSGAVETDEPAVAADILDADRADLQRFLDRAGRRLVDTGDPADGREAVPVPAQRQPGRSWRRALPALPVVAVLAGSAAAAAIVAPHIGQQSGRIVQSSAAARPQTVQAAGNGAVVVPAGFEQLRHAIVGHASAREVLAAADRWHRQLEALIATAAHNPRQLRTVITLLRQERQLLATHDVPDVGQVLAAATRIERHLLRTAAPLISSLPIPTQSLLPVLPASSPSHPAHHRSTPSASSPTPQTTPSGGKSQPAPTSSPTAPSPAPSGSPHWTPSWWSSPKDSFFGDFH